MQIVLHKVALKWMILGPRGPKGEAGMRGEKGSTGSFDFLMLMVSVRQYFKLPTDLIKKTIQSFNRLDI